MNMTPLDWSIVVAVASISLRDRRRAGHVGVRRGSECIRHTDLATITDCQHWADG
jgi:hypothetical protein